MIRLKSLATMASRGTGFAARSPAGIQHLAQLYPRAPRRQLSASRKPTTGGSAVLGTRFHMAGTVAGMALALRVGGRRAMAFVRRSALGDPLAPCDYLVVGTGASGMSFVDTLLKHHPEPSEVSVVMVDKRAQPGGHWNDAYGFVTLHQAATNYGVESLKLEARVEDSEQKASRADILDYYEGIMRRFVGEHDVRFFPGASFDFETSSIIAGTGAQQARQIEASTVVDARFTEPDIPIFVKPRFSYNPDCIEVMTTHELAQRAQSAAAGLREHFCVIGGGKTGQDTIIYLQEKLGIPPDRIAWVMPRDPWFTAREPPMDTCMEFLQTCLKARASSPSSALAESAEFVQQGYLELERRGKVYRLDPAVMPSTFMNATLNGHEVEVLRRVSANIIRNGRVSRILDSGELEFEDSSRRSLPWADARGTAFVHCSAGAFNFSQSAAEARRAVFEPDRITVQEIFNYPGFCFNGSLIARLECEQGLSLEAKNAMCELPPAAEDSHSLLGPSAGGIGPLHTGHPLIVSLRNLRRWYGHPGLGEWLHELRLFSLTMNGYSLAEGRALVDSNWNGLVKAGILKD